MVVRTDLPLPDADAIAASRRLSAVIAAEIAEKGGWIPLARFIDRALYAPGLGYYAAGATKFAAGGDFITAPELTPLFAQALATQVAAILDATPGRRILELGAGSGRLAADLLAALDRMGASPSGYSILEPSPALRARQRAALEREHPEWLAKVEWQGDLPESIDGAVIANEVLDAVPPSVVARCGGRWLECGVTLDAGGGFAPDDRPAPNDLVALAQARFPAGIDYRSEVNPAAEALVGEIGRRMTAGALLVIDYGFPRHEYFHPQRATGTLVCHYRHRVHDDVLWLPGLNDITAHVDFTAMADAGERAGLAVAGFAAQAPFLMSCGILDRLREAGAPESSAYIRAASAVGRLLSPAEMGELFKVLALARSSDIRWPGFALANRPV